MNAPVKRFEYQLTQEYVELNHLLKFAGLVDSGGAGGAMVTTGVVSVDGQVELRKRNKIRAGQIVTVDGLEIHVLAATAEMLEKAAVAKPAKIKAEKFVGKMAKKPVKPRGKADVKVVKKIVVPAKAGTQ